MVGYSEEGESGVKIPEAGEQFNFLLSNNQCFNNPSLLKSQTFKFLYIFDMISLCNSSHSLGE